MKNKQLLVVIFLLKRQFPFKYNRSAELIIDGVRQLRGFMPRSIVADIFLEK